MYNASPRVAALWGRLVEETSRLARVPLEITAHAFPRDIEDLWKRPDLGLAFMCGRAFMLGGMKHTPIAVPLRAGQAMDTTYQASPLYHTEFLVAASSPFTSLEDTFGHRLGWTVHHSHSGYIAVREHLAAFAEPGGTPLYAEEVGPLHTPAACLAALKAGEADVAPMDAYYADLLRRNNPEILEGTRVVAVTRSYPMPLLVGAPGLDRGTADALRQGLFEASRQEALGETMRDLCLNGFAEPDLAAYAALHQEERSAP